MMWQRRNRHRRRRGLLSVLLLVAMASSGTFLVHYAGPRSAGPHPVQEPPPPPRAEVFVKRSPPRRPPGTGQAGTLQGGQIRPRLPVRPMPPASAAAEPSYPILLNPLYRSGTDKATSPPDRQRYRQALGIYRRLQRQSDPWLRLVASDLMARCYVGLQQWPLALRMYEEMAGEFGQGMDGSGVPIELGIRFAVADIHARRGAQEESVAAYLTAYEHLVARHYALSEGQRRRLAGITRAALTSYFDTTAARKGPLFERFMTIRRNEAVQLTAEAFSPHM